jgi:flavin reductase (DIM6/NTAB) family NADH-FMN oxidoreductase RutF
VFYETAKRDHGLPHDPFKAIVAPRPIGWISSLSPDGIANLAPYSYFNGLCTRPDLVMFSSEGEKDSLTNIRASGEFVCNHVTMALAEKMNLTSINAPRGVSEFEYAGLEKAACVLVKPPRVAAALAALECKLVKFVGLSGHDGRPAAATMVIGEVVGVHIADEALRDGLFVPELARPVARMGYFDYQGPDSYFTMRRPVWKDQG